MDILVADVEDDPNLVIGTILDEENFAEKFPFKEQREAEERERKRREEEEQEKKRKVQVPQIQVKVGKKPDEIAREKYDKEMKELQRRNKEYENYIELLIENIDRKELQDCLEKPIDTDPLKKLAYIFSHEPED